MPAAAAPAAPVEGHPLHRGDATFVAALSQARGEAIVFLCATATVLYVASYGIWYFEHEAQPEAFATIFHSLWWAVATLTTVGYGDVYPITVGGKIFTSVIAFLSLGVVASLAGLVASALTKVAVSEPRSGDSGLESNPRPKETQA